MLCKCAFHPTIFPECTKEVHVLRTVRRVNVSFKSGITLLVLVALLLLGGFYPSYRRCRAGQTYPV